MNNIEDPLQFNVQKDIDGIKVQYLQLMEIVQGGPETGLISINDKPILTHRFGGPCIKSGDYIYAPVYINTFFRSGFKIGKINIQNLRVEIIGRLRNVISIDKVEGNRIYFFEDLNKTHSNFEEW